MGEVVAPHDAPNTDLVAPGQLAAAGVGRTDLDVAVVVITGAHAHVAPECAVELRAATTEAALVRGVHHVEQIGGPEAPALSDCVLEAGETFEGARPDEERQRPVGPEPDLGDVHTGEADVGAVVAGGGRT